MFRENLWAMNKTNKASENISNTTNQSMLDLQAKHFCVEKKETQLENLILYGKFVKTAQMSRKDNSLIFFRGADKLLIKIVVNKVVNILL